MEGGGSQERLNAKLVDRDKIKIFTTGSQESLTEKVIFEGNEDHHTVFFLYYYGALVNKTP